MSNKNNVSSIFKKDGVPQNYVDQIFENLNHNYKVALDLLIKLSPEARGMLMSKYTDTFARQMIDDLMKRLGEKEASNRLDEHKCDHTHEDGGDEFDKD